jgi:small subunit ribosomal protein S4
MGDPRRTRKKYVTPMHPWFGPRIAEEKILVKEYGLKNKKEIWKMASVLRRVKAQAKVLTAREDPQSLKQTKLLIARLNKLRLVSPTAKMEDVLDLNLKDVLARRLQTIVHQKGLAKSVKQARQFIVHGHIFVGDKKVTVPSYLVLTDEEDKIIFDADSALSNPEHPERFVAKKAVDVKTQLTLEKKEEKVEKKEDKKEDKKKEVKKAPKKEAKKVKNDSTTK